MHKILIQLLALLFKLIQLMLKSKSDLIMENIELRQQLATYQAKKAKPKNITDVTRSFLVALGQVWSKWTEILVIVKPETVINWQKKRFKNYWAKKSSKSRKPGRPPMKQEIRELVKKMAIENPNWGAPRIYSEILMLGYTKKELSQRTVSRYIRKIRSNNPITKRKRQLWKTFLHNHREHIMAMDFFTVPTVGLKVLYVFFIIDHATRKIVHFNVTENPTAEWVKQQLRDAFPFNEAPKYLIFDRDSIFKAVKPFIKDTLGIKPKIISYYMPWQNGTAERYVLSARVEMLEYAVILNESHLKSLMSEYVTYYNHERCHLSLDRDTPVGRDIMERTSKSAKVISLPRLGGLHHKYEWRNAA